MTTLTKTYPTEGAETDLAAAADDSGASRASRAPGQARVSRIVSCESLP